MIGGLVLLVLGLLPDLALRLHHYIVSIMIVPMTAFPTRLSALYQGLLLGLFVNGTAGFGFASILERPADVCLVCLEDFMEFTLIFVCQLLQDAVMGTILPVWLTNSTNYNNSIALVNQSINWGPLVSGWDSFVLLVDDVVRYVGPALNYSLSALDVTVPHFFRLAVSKLPLLFGRFPDWPWIFQYRVQNNSSDFTKAATLWPNGTWIDPSPGPS
jgi:hypothetical protein